MLGLIVSIIIVGLIAGFIARAIVPGRQNLSIGLTLLLGIVGSFVGGFLGFLIFGKDAGDGFLQPAGIIGSIIGAIIVLVIYIQVRGRGRATRQSLHSQPPVSRWPGAVARSAPLACADGTSPRTEIDDSRASAPTNDPIDRTEPRDRMLKTERDITPVCARPAAESST